VAVPAPENVRFAGRLPRAATLAAIAGARFLVMNSTWYEGQPTVLLEALAAGVPSLVPALGAMPEIAGCPELGTSFAPGDPADLVRSARGLWERSPALEAACRARFEERYTLRAHFDALMRLYEEAAG